MTKFSEEVSRKIGHYVYRLIDPRSGETFYVGKGKGNRIFAHVNDELKNESDELSDKLLRIRDIRVAGFDMLHVIHRHGLAEEQAFEVEAALIDAYPEIENELSGKACDERGLMHANQIIEKYEAKKAKFDHSALLITVNRTATERESTYAAVRYAWKLDPYKAMKAEFVMAVRQGIILDVFVADKWLAATVENFPGTAADRPGRWGFIGRLAPEAIRQKYVRSRIPSELRKPGAANPVRYVQ